MIQLGTNPTPRGLAHNELKPIESDEAAITRVAHRGIAHSPTPVVPPGEALDASDRPVWQYLGPAETWWCGAPRQIHLQNGVEC